MKECAFVITVPVGKIGSKDENKKQVDTLTKYLNDGYVVTHITSSVIENNMYVYHWLEKETK